MAKHKKKAPKQKAEDTAALLSQRLGESAQQVWLAGLGAFSRAQNEGGKLFDSLVKEGLVLEQNTRKLAGEQVEVMRETVEQNVGKARKRATDTWTRLEKVFEDRVHRALHRLEIPTRDDLSELQGRIDALQRELSGGKSTATRKAVSQKTAAKKAAAATGKPVRKRPAGAKTAPKTSGTK
ncbi:poly(hydroxyalcanoate) granule associated protein [Pseudoxanthomonas kalamensis DSM 18571]|uniref:phasin family protein n=1 Tax=Pseudoxanthomonas kalamensis TaxID=289483 RepID=UPI0013912940|nr:phasin family protein [Pseudoxanthomonas kalamensis]KAF1707932.1 poly(hydroxyalcanoate) granule associated protein [Pseudoxanthomonas kalamensis DSM 18571]